MLVTRAKLLSRILGQSRNRTISSTSALLSSDIKFRECYGSFIDGSELDVNKFNQSTFMVENPATSEIICKVASANKAVVDHAIGQGTPVLPLKFSRVFDTIFEQERSIRQMMEDDALARYTYRDVAAQFNAILSYLEKHYA